MAQQVTAGLLVKIAMDQTALVRSSKQAATSLKVLQTAALRLQTVLGGLGVGFGFFQLGSSIASAIKVFTEFEFKMSEVKAITGATSAEFKALTDDAIRLGRSTVFTAREVAGLQVAYGRLGFTTKEIIAATEATLNLAAATNSSLADAADVAGLTVRAFQLDASETVRVTDVMTSSFNKSALAIDFFRESMKFVAPIASVAGASVEETTALLGILANAGIRGSIAGTGLRRIFSDLTKDGRPLQERLAELGAKGLTLKDAFDEIGRVAQTSLLVLTRNTEGIKDLTAQLELAAGEGERVASIRLDNVRGDFVRLTSAVEGTSIALQQGGGYAQQYRNILRGFTEVVNNFTGAGNDATTIINSLGDRFREAFGPDQAYIFERLLGRDARGQIQAYLDELRNLLAVTGKPVPIELVDSAIRSFGLGIDAAQEFRDSIIAVNLEMTGFTGTSLDVFIKLENQLERLKKEFENLPIDASSTRIKKLSDEIFNLEQKIANLTKVKTDQFFTNLGDSAKIIVERLTGVKEVLPLLFDAFTGGNIVIKKTFTAYDDLELKLKQLNEDFEKTDELNTKLLDSLGKQIIATKKRIEGLDKHRAAVKALREEKEKDFKFIVPEDAGFVVPDVVNQKFANDQIELMKSIADEGLASLTAGMVAVTIESGNMTNAISDAISDETTDGLEQKFNNLVTISAQLGSGIGDAFAAMATGAATSAQALAQAAEQIVQSLGNIIIMQIAAKASGQGFKLGPFAAIALIAAATAAVSGILRDAAGFQQRGRGGGSGSSADIQRPNVYSVNQGGRLELSGTLIGDGRNLITVIDEQGRISTRTGG